MNQYSQDLHDKGLMRERAKMLGRCGVNWDAGRLTLKPLVSNNVARNGQLALSWTLPTAQQRYMQPSELGANTVTWDTFQYPFI